MASPFTVFRKHQKVLIATLGLLAMIAFVFLGTIQQTMTGGARSNPVVVSTKAYGDIKEYQLHEMLQRRQIVFNVLHRAISEAMGYPARPEWIEREIGPVSEESVVNTWLMAERAKELGLTVSVRAINAFLKEQTADRVTGHQFKTILKGLRVSERQLFEALRVELLARQLQQMFLISLEGTPPDQRWDYYQRLNRRATIEVVPIPVARYIDKVADPDDSELQAFLEEHKNVYAQPNSPEPGFREPQKIALQYFKASYDGFVDPNSVSEEEVKQYYEQFKDTHYLQESLPEVDKDSSDDQKEKPENLGEPKNPAEGAEEGKQDTTKADAPNGTSAAGTASPFRTASFLQDDADQESPEPEKSPKKSEKPTAKPTKPDKEPEKPAAKPKKPDKPAEKSEKPTAKPTKPDKEPEKPAAKPKKPDKPAEKPEKPAEEPKKSKYVPFEKVKKEIRDRLAQEQTNAKIEEVLGGLRDLMGRYHDEWTLYEAVKGTDSEKPAPAKLDFPALARKHGLTAHETGLLSALQAVQLDIGKSVIDGATPFISHAYETLPEYRPAISQDTEGNQYLFWKTKDVEARIPEFTDEGVRQKVARVWKMIHARSFAMREAERLAREARQANKPLEEVFRGRAGVAVIKTAPFSWMTYGAVPALLSRTPPKLSEVDGVDTPGPEFMRTVFKLTVGQVGVAMNQPQTAAYVIRLVNTEPATTVLWELFVADDYSKYVAVAFDDQRKVIQAWQDGLKARAGFRWEREPIGTTMR